MFPRIGGVGGEGCVSEPEEGTRHREVSQNQRGKAGEWLLPSPGNADHAHGAISTGSSSKG